MARAGVEPATFRFSGGRSYQLSYLAGWCTRIRYRMAGASGIRVTAVGSGGVVEPGREIGEVFAPLCFVGRREDVVPHRHERSAQLQVSLGPREEPQLEVSGAVAPAVDMDARDRVEGPDRPFESDRQDPELSGVHCRQVAEIEVGSGFEDENDG